MSRIISFSQMFAITKGANYSNSINFPSISFQIFKSNLFLQTLPYNSNFVPNVVNTNTVLYTTATSSSIVNNNLIFKFGGRLGVRKANQYYPYANTKGSGVSIKLLFGDIINVVSTAVATSTGYSKLEGKKLISATNKGSQTSRCGLFADLGPEGSYASSYAGAFIPTSKACSFYWKGKLLPTEVVNNNSTDNQYDDLAFWVGFARDHVNFGGGSGLTHTPPGGVQTSLNLDMLIGFYMYKDATTGAPKWWATLQQTNTEFGVKEVSSVATGLSVLETQELEVIIDSSNLVVWKANNIVIRAVVLDAFTYDMLPINIGVSLRNRKYQRVTIIPNAEQKYLTEYFYVQFPDDINTDSLLNNETQLNNTGLQILKKLK
jgi:hypothetical protein